jgi:hypothetical protein
LAAEYLRTSPGRSRISSGLLQRDFHMHKAVLIAAVRLWFFELNEISQIAPGITSLIIGLSPGRFILLNTIESESAFPKGIALLSMVLMGLGG